ncbi:SDR family oxidoreductase [Tateyamaria sp.]|uniref:SDR family oxidoreductase n=1 Tax=Tateyamaria sp. TaxID=1929288 RepID=UPI00329C9531
MELKDKTIVVTGAANGIGRALCTTFAAQGAKAIVCVDRDASALASVTNEINDFSFIVDVSHEDEIASMIEDVEDRIGPIDLFCSNAGVYAPGGAEAADEDWQRLWDVNVMAHVWAARHVVPRMVARGGGYLLNTASAAGLLNQIGAAPYGVTKHAAVGLAEWLAMTHGDDGIKVSVLCPQAVRTAMIEGFEDGVAAIDGLLEPNQIADACVEAIRAETFLVLPHPGVLDYMRHKAADYDRWIGGMRKLNRVYSN